MANGLFFNAPKGLIEGLENVGASLQNIKDPTALARLQQTRDQRAQQAELQRLGLATPAARAQRLKQVLSGGQLPAGVEGPVRPLSPQEQVAQLGELTALGVEGAQTALQSALQGQISPEEQAELDLRRQGLGLQEREFKLREKQFAQTVKELNRKIEQGNLEPKEILNQQAKLRGEFTKLSGEFIKQRDAFGRIQASAEDPSAAGDLALIFNYMKLLDPGSVVREGEFATAQNAAGVPDVIRARYNQVKEGKRLAPKTREDFVNRSDKLFNKATRQHQRREEQYTVLGQKAGLDPSTIVLDLNPAASPAAATVSAPSFEGFSIERVE